MAEELLADRRKVSGLAIAGIVVGILAAVVLGGLALYAWLVVKSTEK